MRLDARTKAKGGAAMNAKHTPEDLAGIELCNENRRLRQINKVLLEEAKYASARLLQIEAFLPRKHELKLDARAGRSALDAAIKQAEVQP